MPAGSAERTRAEEEEELFGPDEWVSSSVAGTVSGANATVFGSDVDLVVVADSENEVAVEDSEGAVVMAVSYTHLRAHET